MNVIGSRLDDAMQRQEAILNRTRNRRTMAPHMLMHLHHKVMCRRMIPGPGAGIMGGF